jgi:RNA polymerase sigma-70 factor (ECF subfamily)
MVSMVDGEHSPADDPPALRRARFEALFNAESRAVLGYALRRVRAREDAADVVAETFLVAWRRIDDVPVGREARLWLFGVARRVWANHARGDRRRHRLAERLRENLMTELGSDEAHDTGVVALVRQAMTALDDRDREILQLTSWEGLTPAELATVLSIPAATARSRLHRARKRLKAELQVLGWRGERHEVSGHVSSDGQMPVRQKEDL